MAAAAYCLLIVFVLMGVVAGVYLLMMLLSRPKAKGRFLVVIPAQAREADVAALLCAARLRLGLMGDLCRGEVIALDCGMDEPCRLRCEALCRELDHTTLLGPEQLVEHITMNNGQLI